MDVHQRTFDGYGYRTSSRFGSWTELQVEGGIVSVTGPRAGVSPYRAWIAVQVLLLVLVIPAVLAAVVFWDWRYLILAGGLLVVHWFVGSLGAAGMWEYANLMAVGSGHRTASFPVSEVKGVKIGPAGPGTDCGW